MPYFSFKGQKLFLVTINLCEQQGPHAKSGVSWLRLGSLGVAEAVRRGQRLLSQVAARDAMAIAVSLWERVSDAAFLGLSSLFINNWSPFPHLQKENKKRKKLPK